MLFILLFFSTIILAFFNGANDNFKGVVTLYGSGTVSYKTAITIATIATFLGAVGAIFLARELVANFSGKGLVPGQIVGTTHFLVSVSLGAGSTVMLATLLGFPISTTHSLVGGLIGAGLMAAGWEINIRQLGDAFFLPLLVSPLIAVVLGAILFGLFTSMRRKMGITKESCLCISEQIQVVPSGIAERRKYHEEYMAIAKDASPVSQWGVTVGNWKNCVEQYTGTFWGITIQQLINIVHTISAAALSFARGLNDTPKIAALLVAGQIFNIRMGIVAVAAGMAIEGLLNARRVAETMSNKITKMNHGQGLSANLATSFLVIIASKFGVPVSTTHVSVGSIFGIGIVRGSQNNKMISKIVLSWIITLPVAMALSAGIYSIIF